MLRLGQSKIGRRIGAAIGLTTILFGVVGIIVLLAAVQRTQEENASRLLGALASSLAASYDSYDARHEQHPAGEMAAALSERDVLHELDVFDHEGVIRWSISPERRGQKVDAAILDAVRSRSATVASATSSGSPRVIMPLRKRARCATCHAKTPDPLGGVHLVGSRRQLLEKTASLSAPAVGVTVVMAALLIVLLLLLIDRGVVAPLGKLVAVMSKAEEGDFFARAEVTTEDEIGSLAESFNKMLAKITDLRVEGIESERELDGVRTRLSLTEELSEKSDALEATNTRLNKRLDQIGFLYELGGKLASELDIDILLEEFSALVQQSLGVPRFVVLLLEEPSNDGRPGQDRRIRVAAARGVEIPKKRRASGLQGTISGDALAAPDGGVIYVADLSNDTRKIAYVDVLPSQGTLLCVPIQYRDQNLGVLHFGSSDTHAFTEAERELFVAVGNQAALALANAQLFVETKTLSMTDGLTGIANRRALESRLELEWSKALRYEDPISVVMVDVDYFKVFNDQHGHQLGDETLRRVARLLSRNIRKADGIGRYGGEEFLIVLPRIGKEESIKVANKLRRSIEEADFERGFMQPLGRVTISAGVATYPDDATGLSDLIGAADQALFDAKARGRNCVRAAGVEVDSAGNIPADG